MERPKYHPKETASDLQRKKSYLHAANRGIQIDIKSFDLYTRVADKMIANNMGIFTVQPSIDQHDSKNIPLPDQSVRIKIKNRKSETNDLKEFFKIIDGVYQERHNLRTTCQDPQTLRNENTISVQNYFYKQTKP